MAEICGTARMSTVAPRDLIAGFFADVDAGRAEQAFARLAPDVAYYLIAPVPWGGVFDRDGLTRAAMSVFERLATPLRLSVDTLVAEGDRVVAEVRGHAPTKAGGTYANQYLFLYRVSDGVIVEAKEFLDSAMFVDLVEGRL